MVNKILQTLFFNVNKHVTLKFIFQSYIILFYVLEKDRTTLKFTFHIDVFIPLKLLQGTKEEKYHSELEQRTTLPFSKISYERSIRPRSINWFSTHNFFLNRNENKKMFKNIHNKYLYSYVSYFYSLI